MVKKREKERQSKEKDPRVKTCINVLIDAVASLPLFCAKHPICFEPILCRMFSELFIRSTNGIDTTIEKMEATRECRRIQREKPFFCGPLFSVIFQFSFITPAIKHNFAVVVVGVVVHFFCAVRLLLFVFRFCCQSLFRLFWH